jgi:hypothetical protein
MLFFADDIILVHLFPLLLNGHANLSTFDTQVKVDIYPDFEITSLDQLEDMRNFRNFQQMYPRIIAPPVKYYFSGTCLPRDLLVRLSK